MIIETIWSATARLAAMGPSALGGVTRYCFGLGLIALGYGVRLLIAPQEAGIPYVTFFPAATLTAIFCGLGPALLSTMVAAALATYAFIPPFDAFKMDGEALFSALIFCFDEVVVCAAIEAMRHYYTRNLAASAALKQAHQSEAEARRVADKANLAKSRFLAAASHDLRQPLQALRLYHATLQVHAKDPTITPTIDSMDRALTASEQLLRSLLDVAVIDAGTIIPNPVNTRLADIMTALEVRHRPLAEAKGLRFRAREARGQVCVDPVLLGRILDNLVSNAVRYTQRGGVLVGCRHRSAEIRFEVWDTGIGIAPEHHEAVFEEFFQVGNSARDRSKGTGLGLAVVTKTARLIGLGVTLQSRLGRGTRFVVSVPAA